MEIQCPNCEYEGQGKHIIKGSFWIEVPLWFFFLLPGLIYSIWRLTKQIWTCPKCDFENVKKTSAPKGINWTTLKQSLLFWIVSVCLGGIAVVTALGLVGLLVGLSVGSFSPDESTRSIEEEQNKSKEMLPAITQAELDAMPKREPVVQSPAQEHAEVKPHAERLKEAIASQRQYEIGYTVSLRSRSDTTVTVYKDSALSNVTNVFTNGISAMIVGSKKFPDKPTVYKVRILLKDGTEYTGYVSENVISN